MNEETIRILIAARDAASKELNKVKKATDELLHSFRETEKDGDKVDNAFKKVSNSSSNVSKNLEKTNKVGQNSSQIMKKLSDASENFNSKIKKVDQSISLLRDEFSGLNNGLDILSGGFKAVTKESDDLRKSFEQTSNANNKLYTTFEDLSDSIGNVHEGFRDVRAESEKFSNDVKNISTSVQNARDHFSSLTPDIAMFGAGIGNSSSDIDDFNESTNNVSKNNSISNFFSKTLNKIDVFRDKIDSASTGLSRFKNDVKLSFRGEDVARFSQSTQNALTSLGNVFERISGQLSVAKEGLKQFGLAGATLSLLGPLISMVTALGAQLLALANSAAIAGSALVAGLSVAAAQALPAVGLLALGFKSLTNVMKTVGVANKEAAKSSAGVADANKAQADSAWQLHLAQERVAEAQKNLTNERKKARRELEDMVLAQKRADLALSSSNLSLEDKKRELASAKVTGNLTDITEARIERKSGSLDLTQARRNVSRGSADLNKALDAGVSGSDRVLAAQKELEHALHALAEAQKAATDAAVGHGKGLDQLAVAMAALSPAEKKLYTQIMSLQSTVKKVMSGVRANIVEGFVVIAKDAEKALGNIKIQQSLTRLSLALKKSLIDMSKVFQGKEGQQIFVGLTDAASQTVPIVAKALSKLGLAFGRLALAGRPFVTWMVEAFDKFAGKVERGSTNTKRLTKFFEEGRKHLSAWVHLLGSIVNLFLALGSSGGSATGLKTIKDMTKSLNGFADRIRHAKKSTSDFWENVQKATSATADIFKSFGKLFLNVFAGGGAKSLQTFAMVLSDVLVPALTTMIKAASQATYMLAQVFKIPGVKEFAKLALTIAGIGFVFKRFFGIVKTIFFLFKPFITLVGVLAKVFMPVVRVLFTLVRSFSPVGLAISAIILAITLLNKKFHFIKPTIDAVIGFFKSLAKTFVDVVVPAMKDFGEFTLKILKKVLEAFYTVFKVVAKIVGFIASILIDVLVAAFKVVAKIVNVVFKVVSTVFNGIWKVVRKIIKTVANFLIDGPFGDAIRFVIRLALRLFHKISDAMHDIWGVVKKVGKRVGSAFKSIFNTIKDAAVDAFNWIIDKLGWFWDKFVGVIKGVSGAVKDVFKTVFNGVKDIFTEIFKAIYNVVRGIINGIANGVHAVTNLPGIKQITGGGTKKNPIPPYEKAFYQGGVVKAKPGGVRAIIGEAGYDEVVLTTDPKYKDRTKNLLGMFLNKTNLADHIAEHKFAKGGYVQGAVPPTQTTARLLANLMFSKGFNVTSALRGNSKTMHGSGEAIDFGDSANNLDALWKALSPLKAILPELLAPSRFGLYNFGKRFSSPDLQKIHEDHIHVGMRGLNPMKIGSLLGKAMSGVQNLLSGDFSALAKLGSTITKFLNKLFGKDPAEIKEASVFRATLHNTYVGAKKYSRKLMEDAGYDYKGAFSNGGEISGSEGTPVHILAHSGEMVLNRDQQRKLGGANLLRKILGFGQPRGGSFASGGIIGSNVENDSKKTLNKLDDASSFYSSRIKDLTTLLGKLSTGSKSLKRILTIVRNLTADNGAIAKLFETLETMKARFDSFVKSKKFNLDKSTLSEKDSEDLAKVNAQIEKEEKRKRPNLKKLRSLNVTRAKILSSASVSEGIPAQEAASMDLIGLEKEGDQLSVARARIENDVAKLSSDISKVKGNSKSAKQKRSRLKEAKDALSRSLLDIDAKVSDNLEQRLAKQKEIIDASVTEASEKSAKANAKTDVKRRMAETLGDTASIPNLIAEKISTSVQEVADLTKSLGIAKSFGDKKYAEQIQQQIDDLNASIAELVTERIRAAIDYATSKADKANAKTDVKKRVASALGNTASIPDLITEQINTANQQITDLYNALNMASSAGRSQEVEQIQQRIDELNASIIEMTSERLKSSIDYINSKAASSMSYLDVQNRLANIANFGRANYQTVGGILQNKGSVMREQVASLSALLDDAVLSGNKDLQEQLNLSIQDLNASIIENSLAIEQNTVAALQQKIDDTNRSATFLNGVSDASSAIIKVVGEMTGSTDTATLLALAQDKADSLFSQGQDLRSYLNEFLGGSLDASFMSATGSDLVSKVGDIVASTDLSQMITEEKDQFQALVDAILSNEQATLENTNAMAALSGSMNSQTFTTTAWQKFRQAVFNGSGQLLSQYEIPQMASGGIITKEGLVYLHAGERVLTKEETNNSGGNNISVQINQAGQNADPNLIAKTIAWQLSSRGI